MPTAAVVVIGNEILTGKFRDENGPYLIDRFRTLGVALRRLVTIPDDLDAIAAEVRHAAATCDAVITSGGVGPTHDDVTLEGVARAFDRELETRDELVAVMRRFDIPLDDANLRMARVPTGTELLDHADLTYPVVKVENVYVLPGVPSLFRAKFEAIRDRFAGMPVHAERLYVDEWETAIASRLFEASGRHPGVDIGSYPRFGEGPYKVIVTLEGTDAAALHAARADLVRMLRCVELPGDSR